MARNIVAGQCGARTLELPRAHMVVRLLRGQRLGGGRHEARGHRIAPQHLPDMTFDATAEDSCFRIISSYIIRSAKAPERYRFHQGSSEERESLLNG